MRNRPLCNSSERSRRKAATLVLLAIAIVVLFAFAAISVDIAQLVTVKSQLQLTATSAAAAAALDLPDEETAAASAISIALANMPFDQHGDVLVDADIEFGNWDRSDRIFTADGTPVNAVRVTTRRSSAGGNAVGSFFARFLGVSESDLATSATAAQLPPLLGAIGAAGTVSIGGNATIDSYDSSQGQYDPNNPGSDGDIVAGGGVTVSGNADVNGDVTTSRRSIDYPAVDVSGVENDNDNDQLPLIQQGRKLVSPLDGNRNLTLSANTDYEMPPGVYYFNDLSLGGQSSINISGPTDIYLTGDLDTSGGELINSTENPNNLRIFMTGGTAVLNASVDWYGLLYAPDSDIVINGSGDIYGAIVGNNVDVTGSGSIHFDTSLELGDDISLTSDFPKRSTVVQ